jgi:type II secretory pathway pseudopilin PulG
MSIRSASQQGFTLLEAIIAGSLLAMMVMAVSTMAVSGSDAQEYARRLTRTTEVNQDLMDQIRLEMVSCVRMFGQGAEGVANITRLDLAGAPTPIAGARLPAVSANESPRKDTAGAEITGNTLFFTKLAWSDRFVCTSGNDYMVDVFRWVLYYLTPEDGGPQPGRPIGLNLVRVLSEPMADAAAIDRITDIDDQEEVLLHLRSATPDALGQTHTPVEMVWRRGALPLAAGTLRQINSTSGALSNTPIEGRADPFVIERAGPAEGLLSYRHHSVATNYARDACGVSRYAIKTNTGAGFPHGFEIQVVGPSSARQIVLHFTLASTIRRGQLAWSDLQVTVDARDL